MTFLRTWLTAIILFSAVMALPATGQTDGATSRTAHVATRLVAERDVVRAGQAVRVVLDQTLAEGWHTYWRNPGDTGLPTRISWTLPPGWRAGPIQWPTPSRIMVGDLVNQGYEGNVQLLSTLRAPADAPVGKATIGAQVTWLVCREMCIPERANLSLDVIVSERTGPANAEAVALIGRAQSALPRASGGGYVSLVQSDGNTWLQWPATRAVRSAIFFADNKDVLAPSVTQTFRVVDGNNQLFFGTPPKLAGGVLKGILSVNGKGMTIAAKPAALTDAETQEAPDDASASEMAAPIAAANAMAAETAASSQSAAPVSAPTSGDPSASVSLWQAILFAMIGGAILNFMPCVFPVLSMKAFALARHGRHHARVHGLAYGAGVVLSFALIAAVLLALRAGGQQLGWGFQLQSPLVVTLLAYVMLLLGLSMSGVFTIGARVMGVGSGLASRRGLLGSFFTGVLATVVAAPCTAPFMGAAVGYALLQPGWVSLLIFVALGLGMALPFVALTFFDPLLRRMPKPGLWMERLKQIFAFPLYATAAWLIWVCTVQTGAGGLAIALAGALLIAFAAYLYGQDFRGKARWIGQGAALAAAAAAIALPIASPQERPPFPNTATATGGAVAFSRQAVAKQLAAGRPVLVDFTAAWCITCLANERVALSRQSVQDKMAQKKVVFMKADWTNQDAHITEALREFGRSGVPLYLLYAPGKPQPKVLPQILTESIVLNALDELAS